MGKVTKIDRANVGVIVGRIELALAALGAELGLSIKTGRATFGAKSLSVKIDAAIIAADGNAMTRESENFRMGAAIYGLSPDDLWKTFKTPSGVVHKIIGMRPQAAKRPIMTSSGGKEYVFPAEDVKRLLAREAIPTYSIDGRKKSG